MSGSHCSLQEREDISEFLLLVSQGDKTVTEFPSIGFALHWHPAWILYAELFAWCGLWGSYLTSLGLRKEQG